jgi:hypothetical protein
MLQGVMMVVEILPAKRSAMNTGVFLGRSACLLLLSVLLGCERKEAEPRELVVPSVEWYETHDEERAEKLAECRARPQSVDAMPDCVNASRAENSARAATEWQDEADADEIRVTPLLSR